MWGQLLSSLLLTGSFVCEQFPFRRYLLHQTVASFSLLLPAAGSKLLSQGRCSHGTWVSRGGGVIQFQRVSKWDPYAESISTTWESIGNAESRGLGICASVSFQMIPMYIRV